MALLLASVGLYAVIAHSVGQRTQEIGVRMAMGASTWSILSMVLAHGMRQLIIGLAAGLAVSFGLNRVLGALLVGVTPADPLTFVTVALVLTLAGVVLAATCGATPGSASRACRGSQCCSAWAHCAHGPRHAAR